ncbi:DUF998 domain-containing protein [Nonomuraea rubra]
MTSRALPALLGSGVVAGERAWLQTINFVLGGLLVAAFALGVRRVLRPGRGATWGPILLATAAAGLVVAGPVPTDPALGYPPGQANVVTTSGRVHQVAGFLLFAGLSGAAFALAGRLGERAADGRSAPGWPVPSSSSSPSRPASPTAWTRSRSGSRPPRACSNTSPC